MSEEELYKIIDWSRLSRDYRTNPIKKISYHKYNYLLTKEDLEYLYLELNFIVSYISKAFHISSAMIRGLLLKYNIEKPLSLKTLSIKKSKLEKYGDPNYNNLEKNKQTKLEKYNNPNYNNREKARLTGYNKQVWLEKTKQTKLKNHGDSNYNNREKAKQTTIERYGVENIMKNKEIAKNISLNLIKKFQDVEWSKKNLEKHRKTCLEKYGYIHQSQIPKIKKQKKIKTEKTIISKYSSYQNFYQTKLREKYNVSSYPEAEIIKQKKSYQTKKLNNSFNISKPEKEIYNLLLTKYPDTVTQYRSNKYPFNCDFYIPSLDVYIEYQGTWTHGPHPFNENNPEDLKALNTWKEKSSKYQGRKNLYQQAIYTWTDLDIRKRKIAKENNLNYLEFFNIEDFMDWFNK